MALNQSTQVSSAKKLQASLQLKFILPTRQLKPCPRPKHIPATDDRKLYASNASIFKVLQEPGDLNPNRKSSSMLHQQDETTADYSVVRSSKLRVKRRRMLADMLQQEAGNFTASI